MNVTVPVGVPSPEAGLTVIFRRFPNHRGEAYDSEKYLATAVVDVSDQVGVPGA
jgi:hypothetical protein